jgi:hypothetical protein
VGSYKPGNVRTAVRGIFWTSNVINGTEKAHPWPADFVAMLEQGDISWKCTTLLLIVSIFYEH